MEQRWALKTGLQNSKSGIQGAISNIQNYTEIDQNRYFPT